MDNNAIASTSQNDNKINRIENRDDIIAFYNKIFVPKIQVFAMRFSSNSQQVELVFLFFSFLIYLFYYFYSFF